MEVDRPAASGGWVGTVCEQAQSRVGAELVDAPGSASPLKAAPDPVDPACGGVSQVEGAVDDRTVSCPLGGREGDETATLQPLLVSGLGAAGALLHAEATHPSPTRPTVRRPAEETIMSATNRGGFAFQGGRRVGDDLGLTTVDVARPQSGGDLGELVSEPERRAQLVPRIAAGVGESGDDLVHGVLIGTGAPLVGGRGDGAGGLRHRRVDPRPMGDMTLLGAEHRDQDLAAHDGGRRADRRRPGALDKTWAANLRAPLLWVRAAHRASMEENRGTVVNVASAAGLWPGPATGAYNISRAGVVHMTRRLAHKPAPRVRVNAAAGVVRARLAGLPLENQQIARMHPLGRVGEPDDVARLIALLASDSSSPTTGAVSCPSTAG